VDYTLWEHQVKTISRAKELGNLALLQDPGVGKTLSTIKICEDLWADGIKKTLIFTPVAVLDGWKKEFLKFSDIDSSLIHVIKGTSEKRLKILNENLFDECVFIINYEAVQNKLIMAALTRFKPHILICDESHRCKNPSSTRAKQVVKLADCAPHRFILTGTPILSSSMDLFMQFRILDKGVVFGKNFFAFRHRYFEDKNAAWASSHKHFPEWVPRKGVVEEFNQKVDALSVKAKKEECLDLPPFVEKLVEVEMTAPQRKAYESMRDECIAYIDSGKADGKPLVTVAEFALHRALRMQQIVCGFAKTDDGGITRFKKNPRLEALRDLVQDISPYEKIIIWTSFVANQDDIVEMLDSLKIRYATLFGRTKDKQQEINNFQNLSIVRVMVANQSAGGVGVNLQAASTAIYYSKSFSLEHDIQSVARCYRGGSEIHDKITRIDLITPDTIDGLITEALKRKEDIGRQILEYTGGF